MLGNRRWFSKVFAISAISFGIGLLIGTLFSWGWLTILLALACIIFGVGCMLEGC